MQDIQIRTPQTSGWIVINRSEYESMRKHDHAGTDADGTVWALARDFGGATCLWRGLEIVEGR